MHNYSFGLSEALQRFESPATQRDPWFHFSAFGLWDTWIKKDMKNLTQMSPTLVMTYTLRIGLSLSLSFRVNGMALPQLFDTKFCDFGVSWLHDARSLLAARKCAS